jgi:sugar/nucleoside kinase (ribokinase family)
MSHDYDVIVYGTVCLDTIWRVPYLPPPGGYMEILEECKAIGGEAGNTAMALSRWGARVALVGNALGADADGALLRSLFAADAPDLDTRHLTFSNEIPTPYCICIATPDGQRTMYGSGFAALHCPPLDRGLARSARFFTLDPNAWEAGLRAGVVAAEEGLFVVAMDYSTVPSMNEIASIVVTSHEHVGASRSPEEYAGYAAQIRDQYGPTTIVTRGEHGCFVAEKGGAPGTVLPIPAYVAPEVVDSTGAGDIFRAGLIYGQMQEWELPRTLRFASAAAALNCGAMGGWGGVRSLEEIAEFQRAAAPSPPTPSPRLPSLRSAGEGAH